MLKQAIIAAVMTASIPAQAQSPLRQFQSYGFPENDSCGEWTSNRALGNRAPQGLEGWVLGFVTAANIYGSNDGRLGEGSGSKGMLAWIDQYCACNPLDTVLTASAKLIIELKKRRGLKN
jgi:hypothetical protein